MEIEQFNRETKGFFKASDDGKEAGRMTYYWKNENHFVIDHTEVNDEYGGQGVGLKMVEAAVAFARENNLKITPTCPFAKKQFDRHKDWEDVLYAA